MQCRTSGNGFCGGELGSEGGVPFEVRVGESNQLCSGFTASYRLSASCEGSSFSMSRCSVDGQDREAVALFVSEREA